MTEKAADIEKTIVVKEHERARYDFDPTNYLRTDPKLLR